MTAVGVLSLLFRPRRRLCVHGHILIEVGGPAVRAFMFLQNCLSI